MGSAAGGGGGEDWVSPRYNPITLHGLGFRVWFRV